MSWLGDVLGNEKSHMSNLFGNFGIKNAEQMVLGAADPIGAGLWSGITGQHFTPMVGQLGGETGAQYDQSDAQGVNTGPGRFMGKVADMIAGTEAGGYFGGGGGLLAQGSGALSGTNQAAAADGSGFMGGLTGLGAGSSPIAAPPGSDSSYPQQEQQQSTQQMLAAALMRSKQQNGGGQGTPLQNLSQLSNKTLALGMMQPNGGVA